MITMYLVEKAGQFAGFVTYDSCGDFYCDELKFSTEDIEGHAETVQALAQWMLQMEDDGYDFFLP